MKKNILYIAVSLDGYIATKDHNMDWLQKIKVENTTYYDFIKEIDVVVMGKTTYDVVNKLTNNNWPYSNFLTYVFTNKNMNDTENIKFVNGDFLTISNSIKLNSSKNVWICGGKEIVNQYMKHNLIDEFRISIIPTILGEGIKLFDNNDLLELKLVNVKKMGQAVELTYIKK